MIAGMANPQRFLEFSGWALPVAGVAALALFAVGLPWGLHYSPPDYQQGEMVRVMYVHVPAAWWSMGIYAFMAGASFVSLVWRHALADVAARAAAPIGATYAALCLATGSLWGAPTWGTWWVWDARLTSMLVLFLTYLGYLALTFAIEDAERGARIAGVLCLAGAVNLPIVHFSVEWWSTLHQPSSFIRSGGSALHPAMLGPLMTMAGAYAAAFAALLFANMRAEIFRRRALAAQRARARAA
ncbi:MAG: heme ABC transporter permease [Hyphomonadaceae bacterium]|nr:heme ABC transporter permease [Hyphomonadaceae bacterium]